MCSVTCMDSLNFKGSATEQNGVQDFKISLRSQDFYGISIFHKDFKISYRFQDLDEISQDLSRISLRFCKISRILALQ